MNAGNETLSSKFICSEFKSWFEQKKFERLTLDVIEQPFKGTYEDYNVVYSLKFLPPSLEMIQLEIWVTDKGYIGIGIESWPRVLNRFGKNIESVRFVVGHEPISISIKAIIQLMEIVSSGKIVIKKSGIALFKLYDFKAYISNEDFSMLKQAGYSHLDFLVPCALLPSGEQTLQFKAWG